MAPDAAEETGVLFESDVATPDFGLAHVPVHKADKIKWGYKWHYVIFFGLLHLGSLYGLYLFFVSAKWQTNVFAFLVNEMGMLGTTAGAHRLWTHKSYSANWPLRLILAVFQTISHELSVIYWVQLHRTHHKYSDTDADPTNASRGFFFAHFGWLLVKEHPEYLRKRQGIDMDDVYDDRIALYQDKFYPVWAVLACYVLPTLIPVYFWEETWTNAYFVCAILRITVTLNSTACINSVGHMWGNKPYDKTILPTETSGIYCLLTLGEGFHNFHHTFPWDYKTSELCSVFNFTEYFIKFFAKIGWAYDLKTVSKEIVAKRAARTGDGSRPLWGWGDSDQTKEEMEAAIRINPKHD